MKIISVQYHDERHTFAASFDDGITTILDADLQYKNMLSTGLDSYFIKKGKWPTKKNIQRRVEMMTEWIMRNKKRYKKWPESSAHDIIKE